MQKSFSPFFSILVLLVLLIHLRCGNETKPDTIDPVASLYSNTQVISNIEYRKTDSVNLVLDIYVPCKKLGEPPWNEYSNDRKPTLLFLHGGGWRTGDKVSRSLFLMPYIARGWCVVTANYRHLDQAGLPAIIGDARSALNWIYDNADKYKFDTSRIVTSGESAGGHLALTTGLITDDALFQTKKKAGRILKVAGIVNWFGVADLVKASKTWEADYYKEVGGDSTHADSIFRICSPINYITSSSPPIITIHGDQDKSAPYDQAPLLQNKLNESGVKNYLHTVTGKKHGNFDAKEMTDIHRDIWKFLKEIGVE
jgi:acetyl esterase/lipase